jgi:hypothetical protein
MSRRGLSSTVFGHAAVNRLDVAHRNLMDAAARHIAPLQARKGRTFSKSAGGHAQRGAKLDFLQ